MSTLSWGFPNRIESLRARIGTLSSLRALVALPPDLDIAPQQWAVLEPRLAAAQARLLDRVNRAASAYLPTSDRPSQARRLNAVLGEIELEISTAFTFFDTYVDVLTQRRAPELGALLAGCDVLARDALRRDHPALLITELPLVYCDRGFGAAIMREEVPFPDRTPNPMPLVQIPYARLSQKYNLTSLAHEAGHQALKRIGLVDVLPAVFRAALRAAGWPPVLQDMFALWASEIGPDFWTFCCAGMAQASGIRDLLSLPPGLVFRVSATDPHPPPYLRVLLGFELCRQMWGLGAWDRWERRWRCLYPLRGVPPRTLDVLAQAERCLPVIAGALLTTRFQTLGGRRIRDLFQLSLVHPERLQASVAQLSATRALPEGTPPCTALAIFSALREQTKLGEAAIDALMTDWLSGLGRQRTQLPTYPDRHAGGNRHAR